MPRIRLLLVTIAVLALALFTGATAFAAPPDPAANVTITPAKTAYAAGESVVINVTVANPTDQHVKVLKWYTAVEDVEEPLFAVAVNGAAAAYLGPVYKRPAPKSEDYINLKPGASFTRPVDLGAYYDLSVTGNYTIRYDVAAADLYAKSNGSARQAGALISNEIVVYVEGRAPAQQASAPQAVTGSTTFSKCTASQQSALVSARGQASSYAAGALGYLNANKQGSRYTTWFGAITSARYSTVTSHFGAISNAMDTAPVRFDCGCKKQYYAYVYPNQPYNIYLCRVFWNAPLTGTDSKAGTLIHEMSHFKVVASTNDYVYGQTAAKSLAISNPNNAVANADNHEYFAENTPPLQ